MAASVPAHIYFTLRMVAALLLATVVPLVIDRRARQINHIKD